jgi:hypothetical protein
MNAEGCGIPSHTREAHSLDEAATYNRTHPDLHGVILKAQSYCSD